MPLNDIVNITIDAQTTSPTRVSFGIPLVAGYTTVFTDSRVRYYSALTDMISDGFTTDDAIYKAVKACLAQNPRPSRVAVGRFDVASTMTVNCTPVVQNSHAYTVTINGVDFTFTSSGGATDTEIVDGLVALINAGSEPVTASNAADVLHLVSDVAGDLFDVEIDYRDFEIQDITPDTSDIEQQLADISIEDDAWYALVLVPRGASEIAAAAGYIETVKKIAIFSSGDSDILDPGSTTDVAAAIQAAAYVRSAVLFHRLPHEYAHGAWVGEELPNDPGSSTWAFKTLAGITVDTLTATEVNTIKGKSANYYTTVAGVNITQEGKTGGNEFIDVTIFLDWLASEMQVNIFAVMANVKKIPMTDGGIGMIEGAVRGTLQEGVDAGGLADDDVLQVTVPAIEDVAPADRAARILRNVRFQGRLAGAIHQVIVNGTVTV